MWLMSTSLISLISDAVLSGNLEKWDDVATDFQWRQDTNSVWCHDTDEKGCLINLIQPAIGYE